MALPPKGDPRRPLHLAVHSMLLLGIVFALLGLLVMAVTMNASARIGARGSLAVYIIPLFYLVPGVLYILFSIFLRQRQQWAVIASLALVGVHELMALLILVRLVLSGVAVNWVLIVVLVWILALAQLLFHLAKSFESIRAYQELVPRGFEPLPPTNLPPPAA